MATLYHGTTLDNYHSILRNGFGGGEHQRVWQCSDLGETYFYSLEKEESKEEYECVRDCFVQASIAAAVNDYNGTALVVIRLEVSDDHVEDDNSYEGADYIASCVDNELLSTDQITGVFIAEHGYKSSLRLFALSSVWGSPYMYCDLSDGELEAVKAIQDAGIYLEEIHEYDWEALELALELDLD